MTDLVGNRTLRDLVRERADRYPDRPFLICPSARGGPGMTFSTFSDRVRSVAGGLEELGIRPGDAVLVVLPNCEEFVVTFFALAWMGAVMVSANPASTRHELLHMARHSEAVGVLADRERADLVDDMRRELPALRLHLTTELHPSAGISLGSLIEAAPLPDRGADSEDVVQMLFTSGSTALPKAVLLTHANMLWAGERSVRNIGLQDTDRYLTALPFFHVNAQCLTLMPSLTAGAACILLERFSASSYLDQLRYYKASVTSLVATQVRTLLAQPPDPRDTDHQLRRTFYAINVTDAEKDGFERRFGVELINGYGLTEACTNVTASPLYGDRRWPSVGLPSLGRQVRVVAADGRDAAIGTLGEILVEGVPGRTLMKGYFQDPDATAAAMRGGYLHTGDFGYLDAQGYLYFVDRSKDLIKRAGENVSATEVESVLLRHHDVLDAAVIGVPDPVRDESVVAFVVLNPGSSTMSGELIQHCGEFLASFKVPTTIEIRTALPKTSIGKIDKKILRQGVPPQASIPQGFTT